VRFIVSILFLISLCSLIAANASVHYTQDGLSIDRQLTVQPIGGVDTNTGVMRTRYSSTIMLIVANPGPTDRQNVVISEDLTYLPSYIRLSISGNPDSDGRTARWTLPSLPAGRSIAYSISLSAFVSDGAVTSADPPQVTSDRLPAQLTVPSLVDLNQNAVIVLRSNTGSPLADARIDVIGPDSHSISLSTDPSGRAFFTATQTGFYSYEVLDYRVAFRPTTEVRPAPVPVPSTTGAVVASPSNTTSAGFSSPTIEISGLWPVVGALLMIGIVAFGLYVYLNRPADEEPSTPPAPATRPLTSDGVRISDLNSPSEPNYMRPSAPSAERSDSPLRDSSSSLSPSLSSASRSESSVSAAPSRPTSESNSSSPSASATSAGSSTIPTTPANPADSEKVRLQTRSLISERRGMGGISISPTRASPASLSPSPSSLDWDAKPSVGEETTVSQTGSGDTSDRASETQESAPDSNDPPSPSDEASPSRPVPSWMTRTPSDGENSEVDDEAISKTIAELEALRDQLRSRSSSRESRLSEEEDRSSSDSSDARSSDTVISESALPPDEEAQINEILSAEPVEETTLVPEAEARIEQEAESIDTEVKGSDDAPSAPSLFTPTPVPAPEHPMERPKLARRPKSMPAKKAAKPASKQTWTEVKSISISERAKRGPGRPRNEAKTSATRRPARETKSSKKK